MNETAASAPADPVAVRADRLEKRYGAVAALDGVSFALEAGSLVLIAGPNGAGKSTLLRVLGSLTRPTRGEVAVLGENPFSGRGTGVRARVAYLGPEPGLYGELSVEENLRFCAQMVGATPDRVLAVLHDLGIHDHRRRRVRTLSLGYTRRAGLARALLGEPDLLLLDEPWNGLDAASARSLELLLVARREAGATTLVAAHAVAEHADLFDLRLAMERGRLVSVDTEVGA